MRWWNSLSIRTQLVIFMTLLVTILEAGSLLVINQLDKKESERHALDIVRTVSISLNNDLIKAPLAPNADTFADINSRIAGFSEIKGMLILDERQQPVMQYGDPKNIQQQQAQLLRKDHLFGEYSLFAKSPLTAEGYTFGYTLLEVDMSRQREAQMKNFLSLLLLFPVTLLVGFVISWILSLNYTRPFSQLAQAMRRNDVGNQQFYKVKSPAKNEVGQLFDGYNQMIDHLDATIEELHFQSEHDALTGLYNRFFIEREIRHALQQETQACHALIMIDLDQFNTINNSAGFLAGDELLKMIALQCDRNLPEYAQLARIGGDDFYLLLNDVSEEKVVELIRNRMVNLSDFRFSWETKAYAVSASMGVVLFKPNQFTFEELIKAVHAAFHSAKAKGRGQFEFYQPGNQHSNQYQEDIQVANQIKEALSDKGIARFELFAQAIVPLQQKAKQISYEILLRLWDNQNEFLSPATFLPTAERYQLMAEIDVFVLEKYLQTVTEYPEHINDLHLVHINLAGSTLNNSGFQNHFRQLVSTYEFPWHKLELEVTETSAVGNFNQAKTFIDFCKQLGIGLALDDFGTGMSSFEYLKSLPFDIVKIDGSFVKDMHTDPSDKAVIRYIQEISELRGQETVAEYVETQQDVDTLKEIGITYGQGYFLGRPKPLIDWLSPEQIQQHPIPL